LKRFSKKYESIADLCRRHGVAKLRYFARRHAKVTLIPATSDLDFCRGIRAERPWNQFPAASRAAKTTFPAFFGRKVDLVEIKNVKNPYILKDHSPKTKEPSMKSSNQK